MAQNSALEPGDICLSCGICCGIPMFSHVELTDQDRVVLRDGGHTKLAGQQQFTFPCPNQCGAACGIYSLRPQTCRDYACKTLAKAKTGKITVAEAKSRVASVAALYHQFLGTVPANLPLTKVRQAIEDNICPPDISNADFQNMRLAFVALQLAIDRHIRSGADALVQSAMIQD